MDIKHMNENNYSKKSLIILCIIGTAAGLFFFKIFEYFIKS